MRCTTRCATTAAPCCGSPTSALSSTTPRWGWPTTSTGPRTWCSISTRPVTIDFAAVVAVAHLVRQALADCRLSGAVKTSGAKGIHVFVPIDDSAPVDDVAAATRALAARAEALDPAWPRPRSSSRTAAARCSWTPPAQAAQPSPPPTVRASARARRSRFRWTGRTWTAPPRPTSRCTRRSMRSAAATRGRSRCPNRSACQPI